MKPLVILLLACVVSACGAPLPRGQLPVVAYTSADGIALQQPGGAIHFYRFKAKAKRD